MQASSQSALARISRDIRAILAAIAITMIASPTLAVGVGDLAPPFALPAANGESISLEKLRGKIVYVDFWASWCAPCRRSFPWMNEIQQRYGSQGVAIVAINVDAKREDANRFLRQYPASFVVAFDGSGATPGAYDAKAMPSSYLIDGKGRIVVVEQGFRDEDRDALEGKIRSLIAPR
jgi:thiol-disulfide isomerase/thioredoxin